MSLYRPCTESDLCKSYIPWCHSVPFQDAVNNMGGRAKVVNVSSYLFIITKPYSFWPVQQAIRHMKEYVSDILYIGTTNMQWSSPLYYSSASDWLGLLLWQHYTVLFSYQATVYYTVYTYTWSDSHKWHAPSEVTSEKVLVLFVRRSWYW